jgi:thioredoxin reductase
LFVRQAEAAEVEVREEEAISITPDVDGALVRCSKQSYAALSVIVASGTRPRRMTEVAVPDGISHLVGYDARPLRNDHGLHVAIVGAGDVAFDWAIGLAARHRVTILGRSPSPRCLPLLREKAEAAPAVSYVSDWRLMGMAENPAGSLDLRGETPFGPDILSADRVLFAIGRLPELGFLESNDLEALESADILRLAGDVSGGIFRQTAIAAGDGIRAAMELGIGQEKKRRETPEAGSGCPARRAGAREVTP